MCVFAANRALAIIRTFFSRFFLLVRFPAVRMCAAMETLCTHKTVRVCSGAEGRTTTNDRQCWADSALTSSSRRRHNVATCAHGFLSVRSLIRHPPTGRSAAAGVMCACTHVCVQCLRIMLCHSGIHSTSRHHHHRRRRRRRRPVALSGSYVRMSEH